MRTALALSAALLTACSTDTPETVPLPSTLDGVERFEDLSNEHVTEPVEYEQVLRSAGGTSRPRGG